MGIVACMAFTLPQELEDFVLRQVRSGRYRSADEVIVEALTLLEEREHVRALRRDRLLRDLADGVFQADNHHYVDAPVMFEGLAAKAASAEP